jgi:hypothetical protein
MAKKMTGRIFSIRNEDAAYSERDGQIKATYQQRSFKVVRHGKRKAVIYEVFRKRQKPIRRATIKARPGSKEISYTEAMTRYKGRKAARRQRVELGRSERYSNKYSTNQRPRYSMQNTIQLQLVAQVRDTRTGVSDVYMGYSVNFKMTKRNPGARLQAAYQQAMDMCIGKFYSQHGLSKSGDAAVSEISRRYIVKRER